jgi:hypothetical protein
MIFISMILELIGFTITCVSLFSTPLVPQTIAKLTPPTPLSPIAQETTIQIKKPIVATIHTARPQVLAAATEVPAQTTSSAPQPTINVTPVQTIAPQKTQEATIRPTVSPVPTQSPHPPTTPITKTTPSITPSPTSTPTSTPTLSPTTKPVSKSEIENLIIKYSDEYKINKDQLRKIAVCESGLNPKAENLIYEGLFQFAPASWKSYRKQMNADTSPELRTNAEEAIKTAAYMLSQGKENAWPNCK